MKAERLGDGTVSRHNTSDTDASPEPARTRKREQGLMVVEHIGPRFYFHTDSGVTSCDFEQVQKALAADDLVLMVLGGVRPA